MRVRILAQAKLNLRLKILARETSGYHSIETIFHKIALADEVTVTLRPSGERRVRCSVDVGPERDNLAYRAALAFLEATHWETGFEIDITKQIPAGGGLGGGSADAAATLRALNSLAPMPLSGPALLHVAARLGSDVPFLASDATMALAWGHGERMLSLDALPQRSVALVLPPFRIGTADAYEWVAEEHFGDPLDAPRRPVIAAAELRHWHLANWEELRPWADNDFQAVIAGRYPTIDSVISKLRGAGAILAGMTGSGSTLFGVFDAPPNVAELAERTSLPVVLTQTTTGVEAVHQID